MTVPMFMDIISMPRVHRSSIIMSSASSDARLPPPVVTLVMMSHLSLIISTYRLRSGLGSGAGFPVPGSLAWRCTMLAPASQHRTVSSVISSAVVGTWGVISLLTGSPPVTAAVMMSLLITITGYWVF